MKRSVAVLATTAVGLACFSASALGSTGSATYRSTSPLNVPNLTGIAGVTNQITVPTGRTAINSLDVNLQIDWAGGGGQELGLQLQNPAGQTMFLFPTGCPTYPVTSDFTVSDSGTERTTIANFCTNHLVGGTGLPEDPDSKKLSFFAGASAAGNWLLRAIDSPGITNNQGKIDSWALKVTHAEPTLTTDARKQKVSKTMLLTATANANGNVVTGGDAKASTTPLSAGTTANVPFKLTKKAKKKVKKGKKKVKVQLTFNDVTNGSVTKTVPVKLKIKK